MFKKLLIIIIIFTSFSFILINKMSADLATCGGSTTKINCSTFEIDPSNFSPGGGEVLGEVKAAGGNTEEAAKIVLSMIIRNLIVVFGVLSLLIMIIGGGMMVFHAGQESILTKGKTIFMYGIISLVVGLSSGLIVGLVSYLLY